jgi:hypothetical protein
MGGKEIMSRLIFDKKDASALVYLNDDNEWTTARFEDEFFLDLTRVRCEIKILGDDGVTSNVIHYKKYYRQAISKIYRIPLTEQIPKSEKEELAFVINFNDLSSRVQKEFLVYCKLFPSGNVTLLLKKIVIRLFENLDYNYAHMSVMRKLRVKVVN